ncbi:MAG: AAA family ATPase, partial [Spirochaetota bacterium]
IRNKHLEYSKRSEELELSLNKRLINKEIQAFASIEQLKKENQLLEQKRKELKSVGLFENVKEEIFHIEDDIGELTQAVLSVNLQNAKAKLDIFNDIYQKLKVFLDILNNKRLSYKTMSIHPEQGFVFQNSNGTTLDVAELSSGEQHEIVLLYELLFKIPEESLVLIDEPEISLHVVWQKEFLEDMKEIIKLRNFDILIATHSPQIINGNWDLTVELKGEKATSA